MWLWEWPLPVRIAPRAEQLIWLRAVATKRVKAAKCASRRLREGRAADLAEWVFINTRIVVRGGHARLGASYSPQGKAMASHG